MHSPTGDQPMIFPAPFSVSLVKENKEARETSSDFVRSLHQKYVTVLVEITLTEEKWFNLLKRAGKNVGLRFCQN